MKRWMLCIALPLALIGCDDETMTDAGPGDTDAGPGETDAGPPAAATEWAVLIRGELFTTDLDMAQMRHDPLAAGGESQARMLGDFAHDVHLGTTLLGSTENEFAAVDRWTDLNGLMQFYADPDFMMAFGMLFAAPPTVETFARQPAWYGWGDLDATDAVEPHFRVVIRGRLADAPETIQPMHDGLAAAGEMQAMMAGDVAHVVYLGVDDPREFLAFDLWTSDAGIEAFYGNPDFMTAFGALFEGPATVAVYRSTDWHQW